VPAAQPRQLEVYVTSGGKTPFTNWLDSLRDRKARAKIRVQLDRVRLGNLENCKPVGEGVSELRIDYGPGYRVYFGQEGNQFILLLCGGDKSSQRADIRRAQSYWADYKKS